MVPSTGGRSAAGRREGYEAVVEATEPGVWALHCHILSHVQGPDGMFGMATALVVSES